MTVDEAREALLGPHDNMAHRRKLVDALIAAVRAECDEDGRRWREAEAEGHVVTFSETGYGLMHPPSCRPDLIGCWFNTYLADLGYPDEEPGRYRMTRHKGHAEYRIADALERKP